MPDPIFKEVFVLEDNPLVIVSRETDGDGTDITQAGISTITYSLFLISTGATRADATDLTVASVVFDTLQETSSPTRWLDGKGNAIDATGYNFRHTLAGTLFPTAGEILQLEHFFTPASGNAFTTGLFKITVVERLTG